ncbi:MAG TPA: FAD-dependent monooxygenase [Solirubrobacterales bacterium]|nr:FAD-dependent monooxygenase [Solirubrobacterales bacterium]
MGGRALVAGAGIGGLAVARLLRDAGFEVEVLERSQHLAPLGAGITLWPNATRVLRKLGLDDALLEPLPMSELGLHRWDGRMLVATDLTALERRYDAPLLALQRTTLHDALLGDGIRDLVRTGAEVLSAEETSSGVKAVTRNGECFEAEVLIGADGVHSAVRQSLLADGAPRSSGILAYRAVIDPLPLQVSPGEYWGAGCVFAIAPIEGRLFWLATRRMSADEPAEPNPIPGLLERHRDWVPEIPIVIEATKPEEVMQHELFDRKPVKRWAGDRIALLGDAAHPMLPVLGPGACQALEDAQALAKTLSASGDVPSALREYQEMRRRRAARLTIASRRIGQIAHLRAAPLRAVRDRAVAIVPERIRDRQVDSIVGRS